TARPPQGFASGKTLARRDCGGGPLARRRAHSSSFKTARNASVGSCTLPRLRIFFLPLPAARNAAGAPMPVSSASHTPASPRFCLRQNACTPRLRRRAAGPLEGSLVQLQNRQECLCGQLHAAQTPHLFLALLLLFQQLLLPSDVAAVAL